MLFYKYPLEQDEIWDGTPTGSTYAWGIANPDLFDGVPDDLEIYLDDDTDQWVATSGGAVIDGPFSSVQEIMDSLSTQYGADSYQESEDGYDEAQSELVVASFDGIPMTTKDVYTARAEYGVDVDVRTRTVAGTRENVGRWRRAMAYNVRRTAADAGWAEISAGIWEYQDGREQAYIMDANDGLLHLYYEGLDYGPYEDELMAMDVFAQLVPGIEDSIDDALAIDPPLGQMLSTSDSYDIDNGMLDDDWEDDFDADEFDPDDDWGFHDVSDYDDDYDDEDDSKTASVHKAFDEHEWNGFYDEDRMRDLDNDEAIRRQREYNDCGTWVVPDWGFDPKRRDDVLDSFGVDVAPGGYGELEVWGPRGKVERYLKDKGVRIDDSSRIASSRTADAPLDDDYDDYDYDDYDEIPTPVTHLLDDDIIMYDDESPIPDPDGIRVTRIDDDTIQVDADDEEAYRHWLRMYGVDSPLDVELSNEDVFGSGRRTAGAWTIDADAPLDNDQKRMLNDAGVAFSQDETDDGKARITLTGTDKVVADTAEMVGLTDDFVNDAEPLSDDMDDDEGDETPEDETPEEETRRDIEDAVESDDMREVSDEDQQRIVDGVTDLLEGWKNDVADRSASRRAEAPGADGTDVSELPVDEHWPYTFESRRVDVDNGRYVSTHEASSENHDKSTRKESVRMAADSYYDEDLGGYPLAVDEDGDETEFDNRREFEDGPLDSYYYQVFDRYGDPRKDFVDGIDEALDGAATLDITYPEIKYDNVYLSTYGDVFECSECDKRFRNMDEAMRHLREESRRALGDAGSGRTASTRTAHQLQSFSINTESHGPVTVDVDMGQQYDNGSTAYTVSIDGIPSAKNGFELSYYGYLSNDTVDDDYEEWSWNVSGSDGETLYDDGGELSGEADSREGAESDMYDAMFGYFNRNLERDIDSYLSDNALTASGRGTGRKADANRSDRRSGWGNEYSDPKYGVLSQTEAVDYMIESSGRPLQAIRRDGETYVLPAGDAVDECDVQVAIVAGDEHAAIQWTRTEDDGIDGAFYIEMDPVPCTHENLNRCLRWFESDPSARPDGTLFS